MKKKKCMLVSKNILYFCDALMTFRGSLGHTESTSDTAHCIYFLIQQLVGRVRTYSKSVYIIYYVIIIVFTCMEGPGRLLLMTIMGFATPSAGTQSGL